jgi:hypothetical protein
MASAGSSGRQTFGIGGFSGSRLAQSTASVCQRRGAGAGGACREIARTIVRVPQAVVGVSLATGQAWSPSPGKPAALLTVANDSEQFDQPLRVN